MARISRAAGVAVSVDVVKRAMMVTGSFGERENIVR
jgi:hypothetical protein